MSPCGCCGGVGVFGTPDRELWCRACVDVLGRLVRDGSRSLWRIAPQFVSAEEEPSMYAEFARVYLQIGELSAALGTARLALAAEDKEVVECALRVVFDERILANRLALTKAVLVARNRDR